MKKMLLNMIMFIKQQFITYNFIKFIKWDKSENQTLKIEHTIFLMI